MVTAHSKQAALITRFFLLGFNFANGPLAQWLSVEHHFLSAADNLTLCSTVVCRFVAALAFSDKIQKRAGAGNWISSFFFSPSQTEFYAFLNIINVF